MKKTSLYIEPDLDRALASLARVEGKSKAQLIRETLAERAAASPTPARFSAIGVFDGPGDVSSDVDRHLTESGFGE